MSCDDIYSHICWTVFFHSVADVTFINYLFFDRFTSFFGVLNCFYYNNSPLCHCAKPMTL